MLLYTQYMHMHRYMYVHKHVCDKHANHHNLSVILVSTYTYMYITDPVQFCIQISISSTMQ